MVSRIMSSSNIAAYLSEGGNFALDLSPADEFARDRVEAIFCHEYAEDYRPPFSNHIINPRRDIPSLTFRKPAPARIEKKHRNISIKSPEPADMYCHITS